MNMLNVFNIDNDDCIILTGNFTKYIRKNKHNKNSLNYLLKDFIDLISGRGKTLAIQSFNWDFCYGKTYSILHSVSQTGIFSNLALKNSYFKRTKHPIYSFAVGGKYKNDLCHLDNKGAFDHNSVFNFMYKNNGVMIIVDLPLQDSFTFVHYVEEQLKVSYRFNKTFISNYIDENNICKIKSYDMYVRNENTITNINPLEDIFLEKKAMDIMFFEDIKIKKVYLNLAFKIISDDILYNNAKNLHQIVH